MYDENKGPGTGIGAPSSGSSSGGDSSSRPAQPCPLHACLLQHGITDLAAFSSPKHLALSQEAVDSNVEPKLAALAADGLTPKQIQQLLKAKTTASTLSCSYKGTFLPNLQLLRQIGAFVEHRPHPKAPNLTAPGKILAASPSAAAIYLSRDHSKVQQLLQWLEGSLGSGLRQLSACKDLCNALLLSAGAASAVCLLLQRQHVPSEQVAQMLIQQPTSFGLKPEVLFARIGAIQRHLGLEAAAALQVAIACPKLLTVQLESSLPALLLFLDGYMGEEGAGRRLVRAQPMLGLVAAKAAARSVGNLAARGHSQQRVRGMISKHPTLLHLDLDSPLQQQKLDWIKRESPWSLEVFLETPRYFVASARRLASRLALLEECGLQPPPNPGTLATYSNARYLDTVRKQLARQGRDLPWASWAEWEGVWLGTEEGREWGFPPLKD
ncbi:hypothetical protein N2152v2_009955 [Parachlorella kessleri]